MKKILYKNVSILMSDRDKSILDNMLRAPEHAHITDFRKSIETDDSGRITFFMPSEGMKWGLIFFLQNLMILQRLNEVDLRLSMLEGKETKT